MRKLLVVGMLVAICIAMLALTVSQVGAKVQEKSSKAQEQRHYLVANLDQARATVELEKGQQKTTFDGEIAFEVIPGEKGTLNLQLARLNLVSKGVTAIIGDCGVIGLVLSDEGAKGSYNSRTGELSSSFQSTLHYELIDKIKGFRRVESEGQECIYFQSYTEVMGGKLVGRLPEALQLADKGRFQLQADVQLID